MSRLRTWLIHRLGGILPTEGAGIAGKRIQVEGVKPCHLSAVYHYTTYDGYFDNYEINEKAKREALKCLMRELDEQGYVRYHMNSGIANAIDNVRPEEIRADIWVVKMPQV